MKDKRSLIRIVRKPDGEIMVDKTGKVAGRGAYLCNSEECLKKALKTKSLEKALKANLDDSTVESLKEQILKLSEKDIK
jgi:predicted RNA-binding protein YlxR (DUF448 family)